MEAAVMEKTEVLPKGWKVVELGDVLENVIGGGTPSRDVERYWKGDIPWITVKDMRTRRPAAIQEHITKAGVDECATNIIPADTVITATRVGLGKVVRVPYPAAINQDLKALIVKPELDKSYLEFWIIANADFIDSIGSGTTVKGIRLNQLKELKLPLAPLPEQRRIVEAIELQLGGLDAAVARLHAAKAQAETVQAGGVEGGVQ
jgi:type I restriction enzyme S subunit